MYHDLGKDGRAALLAQQRAARTVSKRGLAVVALVPFNAALFFALAALVGGGPFYKVAFVVSAVFAVLAGGGGAALIIAGSRRYLQLQRQLETLDSGRQLPEARVVVRNRDRRASPDEA